MVNSLPQPDLRPVTPPPSPARGSVSRSHVARPADTTINTNCRFKPPYGNYAPRACGWPTRGASGARRSRRFSVHNSGGHGFADALPPWSLNRVGACAPDEPANVVSCSKHYNSLPHVARWTCQRFPEPRSATRTALPMQSSITSQPADQSKSNQIKPVAGGPPHPPSVLICVHLRSNPPAPFPFSRSLRIWRLTIPVFSPQKSFKNAKIKLYPESSTNWDKPQPIPGIPPLRHCAPASLRNPRPSRHTKANQDISRHFDCYFPSPSTSAHRSAYQSLDVGRWMFDVGC